MDKSAVGWEHHEKVDKHESQTGRTRIMFGVLNSTFPISYLISSRLNLHFVALSDYKDGFGGAFGVQKDRVDKSAVGWEHHEKVDKHESQRGNAEHDGSRRV